MISRFPTLHLEGGLISSDQIDRIADQKGKDFSIDDIAAAWSDIRSYWNLFEKSLAKLPADNIATSETRNRWMIPFLSTLGYELSSPKTAAEVDGQTYAISHRSGKDDNSTPIHIVGFRQSLDRRSESGRQRLAPHSLLQEYLNRSEHLWGIVTNGSTLRILRNSNLLRKQAYIEFDLEQIMRDEQFADFALLYRLIHVSQLPKGIDDANSSALEQYHKQTIEQGGRVRDHLRDGVEKTLVRFANGFLAHPNNHVLRENVQDKSLEPFEFYQQLLRLIYRFLFLMVSEERNLISDNMTYRQHYSISRIRRLVEVRAAYTKQEDLWLSLTLSFKLFQDESLGPLLGVPTLNGDLFDPTRTSELNENSLSNRDLLLAIWEICMYREKGTSPWRRINYAALDVEELGSVYESLLDFMPVFLQKNGTPEFCLLTGNERKSTGSYYTPPELVNELIQSALVPVIKDGLVIAKAPTEKESALLSLTVCDPACGSGHFLLAAARTIGRELAKARTGDEEPAPEQMRIAIRDTITHCIYGVDKNPLAVDLCKVALWLEGHTKTKPLTFLDHRVRCGDSLVGVFDLAVLKLGIREEAYTAVTDDDLAVVREFKKQNKDHQKRGLQNRHLTEFDPFMNDLTMSRQQINAITDDQPANIKMKKILYSAIMKDGTPWCKDKTACDLWTSAFFTGFTKENAQNRLIPTSEIFQQYFTGVLDSDAPQIQYARRLAKYHRFFHWQIEFPEVFARGGFDCVLGNPPWEIIELKEEEFFRIRDQTIADAPNGAARKKLIHLLKQDNLPLFKEYLSALQNIEKTNNFIQSAGRFPLSARGRINTYAIFTEHAKSLLSSAGRAGIIVPTGIATDAMTAPFFSHLIDSRTLTSLYDFENRKRIFEAIDSRTKFCLLTLNGKDKLTISFDFAFFLHAPEQLKERDRHFALTIEDIWLINPNTGNCPIFRTRQDAEINKRIYRQVPVLIDDRKGDIGNPWGITFKQGLFNTASDSHLFRTREQLEVDGFLLKGSMFVKDGEKWLPLYESKMFWQFDHRFGTFSGVHDRGNTSLPTPTEQQHSNPDFQIQPWYWVNEREVRKAISNWEYEWFLGWRDITNATNQRTFISCIIPKGAVSDAFLLTFPRKSTILILNLYANYNSLVFDYSSRQKVGGVHIKYNIMKQLPVLPPSNYTQEHISFIAPRVLELTFTAWDLEPLAYDVLKEIGIDEWNHWFPQNPLKDGKPQPFVWDENRRAILRAELDVYYAKLYGLSRKEFEYVLGTFSTLQKYEERAHGVFGTRNLVLETWDRMERCG